jgi:hypothetical protein
MDILIYIKLICADLCLCAVGIIQIVLWQTMSCSRSHLMSDNIPKTNKQTNLDYHCYRHLDSMRIKLCSSSICGFWLPLWYLQTLLVEDHDEWSVKCNKQTGQFSMEGKLWPLLTLICDHVNLCLLIQCIFLKDVIGFPFYKKTSRKYWFCLF